MAATAVAVRDSIPYPLVPFRTVDDLEVALQTEGISRTVQTNERRYYQINVGDAMTNLSQVGRLLQIAYARSQDFPCGRKTMEILTQYQSIIKDSCLTSTTFVDASLRALQLHGFALKQAQKNELQKSLTTLEKCSGLADQMAEASNVLIERSQHLCNLAETALLATLDDQHVSVREKEAIEKDLAEFKANKAMLKTTTSDLEEDIRTAQRAENAALQSQGIVDIAHLLLSPLTDMTSAFRNSSKAVLELVSNRFKSELERNALALKNTEEQLLKEQMELVAKQIRVRSKEGAEKLRLEEDIAVLQVSIKANETSIEKYHASEQKIKEAMNSQIEASKERLARITERRVAMQQEKRAANAELAKTVSQLKNLKKGKNKLSTAIVSLKLTIQALGKIKTVFENTRVFWSGVKKQCGALANLEFLHIAANCDQEAFEEEIKHSGLNWLTLAKINENAARAIQGVAGTVDRIMGDLPATDDDLNRIMQAADLLLLQINEENAQIDAGEL